MRPVERIRFASFELDSKTAELWDAGAKVHLQEKPFQLLLALLQQPGEVVSREDLRARLWPEQTYVDFDHGLNVAVSKLRETLGDSAETPRFIETVPRHGYRFVAPIDDGRRLGQRRWRNAAWIWGSVGVFFVLAPLLIVGREWGSSPSGQASVEQIGSLAVLPFKSLSENPAQDYLADGMTGAIITELGQIHALRVISWQSVARFKSSDVPLPEIAYLLDVDAIVTGDVLRSGSRVRVSAQLFAVEPERQMWGDSYEQEVQQLLPLPREVARTIAHEIRVAVTAEEESRLSSSTSVEADAYDAYLRGLYHWNHFTEPAFYRAIEYFEEAVAIDSSYAAAWSALADAWSMLVWYGHVRPHEGFSKAEGAAQRALELDPESAAAHNSMAAVLYCYHWQFSAADHHHRTAIELNPSFARAHSWYSYSLADQGRHDEAYDQIRQAQRLDPLSLPIHATVGIRLYDARRYDEAIRQLRHTLEMEEKFCPALLFLGVTYQRVGSQKEAVDELRQAVEACGGEPTYEAALAAAYASAGRRPEAEATLARLLERSKREYVSAYHIAIIYVTLGNSDEAFEWLDRAYDERSPWMSRLGTDPALDPIRPDERYRDLLCRMGRLSPPDEDP